MLPAPDNRFGNNVRMTVGSLTDSKWWGNDNYYNNTSYVQTLESRCTRDGRHGTKRPSGHWGATPYSRYVELQKSESAFSKKESDGPYRRYQTGDLTYLCNQPLDVNMWEFLSINTRARARTEALNKLRGDSSLQLGADLAEINKTLAMIASPSIAVVKALLAAKHGRWSDVPRHLGLSKKDIMSGKYPANKWLEYQYGWKPLMSSIHDGYNRFKSNPRTGVLQVRRTCSDSQSLDFIRNNVRCVGSVDLKHRVIVDFAVADQFVDALDGVGLANPLSVAWEVVPFSFVVDWFAPVGNVFAAATQTMGLTCLQTVETGITNARVQMTGHGDYDNPGSARHEMYIMGRSVSQDFPIPEFYFKPSPFSTSHVTSALALLRQLL